MTNRPVIIKKFCWILSMGSSIGDHRVELDIKQLRNNLNLTIVAHPQSKLSFYSPLLQNEFDEFKSFDVDITKKMEFPSFVNCL